MATETPTGNPTGNPAEDARFDRVRLPWDTEAQGLAPESTNPNLDVAAHPADPNGNAECVWEEWIWRSPEEQGVEFVSYANTPAPHSPYLNDEPWWGHGVLQSAGDETTWAECDAQGWSTEWVDDEFAAA